MEGSDGFVPDLSSSNPTGVFPFKFGDIQTADVDLRLEPMEGGKYALLHLHSHVLCQSEYFKARLSERWTSSHDKLPLQLTLDRCKNLHMYIKCMELMYVPQQFLHGSFGSVQEAVGVLEVAAQLLFHACVTACMHYLEMVAWSIEEAELVRSCISTFHLKPTSDLAKKLSIPDKPVDVMKNTIASLIWYGARDVAEKIMIDNVEPIYSPTLATLNDEILLEELREILDLLIDDLNFGDLKEDALADVASRLEWILDQLDKCQVSEEAFKILADDPHVVHAIGSMLSDELLSSFLNHMFGILQNGKVIISIEMRVLILNRWLPVIAELDCNILKGEVLCNVVKSLPMINQEMFFSNWIRSGCRPRIFEEAFYCWCGKLRKTCKDDSAESSNPEAMELVKKSVLVI